MASLGNVSKLFNELTTEFKKPKQDLKKCGNLLDSLKVNKRTKFSTCINELCRLTDQLAQNLISAH